MEIKITTQRILQFLLVLSWIIFAGLGIQAAGIIVNTVFTLILTPEGARHLWKEVDLSALYNYDPGYFFVEGLLLIIVTVLKTILFYLIVKLLHSKKLNLVQPFNAAVRRFILNTAYLSLGIGLFSHWGAGYAAWFIGQGVAIPDLHNLHLGGADVWLFMSVILFVIAQVFKRGIEMQEENELTV